MIIVAEVRTRVMRGQVRTGALRFRGGRVMTSGSTGSTPRDWAGGPSIMMSVQKFVSEETEGKERGDVLIHKICIAFKGFLNPRHVQKKTKLSAAALVL